MTFRRPARIFLSYCHQDEALRNALDAHLGGLRRSGAIVAWHDRKIRPGEDWRSQIDAEIRAADIVLLLVSADFMASDYCYGTELEIALNRHNAGEAKVVPIILRPVVWRISPFAMLQALPKDGRPVTQWGDQDAAFQDVCEGILSMLQQNGEHQQGATGQYSGTLADVQLSDPRTKSRRVVGILTTDPRKDGGQVFVIKEGRNIIGRSPDADIFIPEDLYISRMQAAILYRSGCFTVSDLGSNAATFIDGKFIEGIATLVDRATIRIGETVLKFLDLTQLWGPTPDSEDQ